MPKPIDYDALLKDFITDFFPEFIAFADPELYEAIDWSRGYTFLEQELINALRGKFKVRGKRKFTDKLVRVYLKTGEEHLVFIHAEFQHQPEVGFARRMYEYRALIGLRYGVEDISAIAVFTGAAPPLEEQRYQRITFKTNIQYNFICIVAAQQEEQALINASDNPFAIALLAALYAQQSKKKPKLRLQLKGKLFALARSKEMPFDKILKLLIFVRDFVNLPQSFENEFRETQYYLTFPKTEAMTISKGTKEFAAGLYEHVFGYDPAVALEEERKQYKELLEKERKKAEEERLKAEKELQKAEEERIEERQRIEAERQRTVLYFHETLQMPPAEIAQVLNLELAYIESLISALEDKSEE